MTAQPRDWLIVIAIAIALALTAGIVHIVASVTWLLTVILAAAAFILVRALVRWTNA